MSIGNKLFKVSLFVATVGYFSSFWFMADNSEGGTRRPRILTGGRSAIVFGATGATGRQLLRQLLASNEWQKVTTFGRRKISMEEKHEKRVHFTVPHFEDLDNFAEHFGGHDIVFNCLGTTRSQAGGADGFVKVEVDYTKKIAEIASNQGIKSFSVVSAQGANPNIWYVDWIHPLLYTHSLGMKEEVIKQQDGFLRISIFRPGMLNRLVGDRTAENVINALFGGLRVDVLARAMLNDAESAAPTEKEEPVIYEGNTILRTVGNLKGQVDFSKL